MLQRTPGTPLVVGTLLEAGPLVAEVALRRALRPLARRVVLRGAEVSARRRRSRRRSRCSHTRVTCCSSTSSRATRCSPRHSRSSPCSSSAWRRRRPSAARSRSASGSSGWCSRARSVRRSCCSGLVPLVAAHGWRARAVAAAGFASAIVLPLLALSGHNAMRADDFAVVRGGSASLLFRTFVADRIVRAGERLCVARSSRELFREGCCRTSPTGRGGSISRRSSPPGALG